MSEKLFEGMTPEQIQAMIDFSERGVREDNLRGLEHARDRGLIRPDLAHWEVAEFFSYILPLAIFDVLRAPDYAAFKKRWLPIVGKGGAGWLPSIYLAVAASPTVATDARCRMIESVGTYDIVYANDFDEDDDAGK